MATIRTKKRQRVTSPEEEQTKSSLFSSAGSAFSKNAAKWDLEQDYESRPRKQHKDDEPQRLPIKTSLGFVEPYQAPLREEIVSDNSSETLSAGTPPSNVSDITPSTDLTPRLTSTQEILQAKEELAKIAALINEDPEDHIASLKTLAQITASQNPSVTKLGLVTQLAVYKDVIPGYRIRPIAEEELSSKVSKEVRKLRAFEQGIVRGYKEYVQELGRIARLNRTSQSAATVQLVEVATSCVCNLLQSVPHFNHRSELLKVAVEKLSGSSADPNFARCAAALETLFAQDESGNASLEAVQMLAKVIKTKKFHVHESVLDLFLHLRLLTEFSHKASDSRVDKSVDTNGTDAAKSALKRQHRSKKERKLAKERKAIEKEMKEADAAVSHEERDNNQAETLKLVFGLYFRILKARVSKLMGAVLEGLVKYAHLVNQDFFGDLLEALRELIEDMETISNDEDNEQTENLDEEPESVRNMTRESLLCVITAFGLLQGQDAAASASSLGLDLNFFITHLYSILYRAAMDSDIEVSAKSLQFRATHKGDLAVAPRTKVNVSTTIVLLLRSLQSVLLPANARSVPPIRLSAFSKQLLTSSLQLPEKSCVALLGLMIQVAKVHRKKIAPLWNTEERRGDGVFDPLRSEVEGSNPLASTVWEGELLRLHYCPQVREAAINLEAMVKDV